MAFKEMLQNTFNNPETFWAFIGVVISAISVFCGIIFGIKNLNNKRTKLRLERRDYETLSGRAAVKIWIYNLNDFNVIITHIFFAQNPRDKYGIEFVPLNNEIPKTLNPFESAAFSVDELGLCALETAPYIVVETTSGKRFVLDFRKR